MPQFLLEDAWGAYHSFNLNACWTFALLECSSAPVLNFWKLSLQGNIILWVPTEAFVCHKACSDYAVIILWVSCFQIMSVALMCGATVCV